ncbi:MAG: response regulator [Candidatus Korobacteraceae bacterium]|jgi:Fe-S oxidoreductase/CheY-like chemotaxis protein
MATARSYKAQKVVDRLQQKVNRQIMLSLAACVHCGMCTDQCHYVLANPGDHTYAPAYKADRIRKLFKAHIDWTGKAVPWWVGAKSIYTDEQLEDLKDTVFGKCTNCRRCSFTCPMGVDMATFNRMARGLLVHVGVMPEGVAHVSKDQWELGNQMGVLPEDFLETLKWMEEELQSEYNDPSIKIPIDKPDANIMYTINPREAKYDPRTIAEAAAIFHFADENWTMTTEGWDMTNFGLFNGDDELGAAVSGRVYDTAERLRAKKIVMSECGHGYRSTRCEGPNWGKRSLGLPLESSIFTMLNYVKEGRIKVDKSKNTEPVTYHDSCNLARSCGITEEPRELLRLVATDFREMTPNRAENFCCTGGGGAMSMAEYAPRRLQSGKVKAEQLRATGAKIVVTSCHNCVDGLYDLIRHYRLGMEVKLLVNLVSNALVVPARVAEPVVAKPVTKALAGRKILVVDDEPDVRTYLRMIFKDEGAEVIEVPDANQAMRALKAGKPDLMTLDLIMPHKTGEHLYWELRKDPNFADLPIVIITGYARVETPAINFHKFIAEKNLPEPEGFLEKPIQPEAVLDTAIKILEKKTGIQN